MTWLEIIEVDRTRQGQIRKGCFTEFCSNRSTKLLEKFFYQELVYMVANNHTILYKLCKKENKYMVNI